MTLYKNHRRYVKENFNKKNYKTTFTKAISHYQKLKLKKPKQILDVGCANGEFLHLLHTRYPEAKLFGVDIFPDIIKKAKKNIPQATYKLCGLPNLTKNKLDKFDLVFCIGVIGIFDDFKKTINDLLAVTKKNGALIIMSNFNDYDVDARIDFRKKINGKWTNWQKGWNYFSKSTTKELYGSKVKFLKFIKFNAPSAISPHPNDPIRSWTKRVNNKLELTNGLRLIINFNYLIIIK